VCRTAGGWEVVQPDALDPQLAALAGRRAGLQRRLALMRGDPCDPALAAYRLSGPLAPTVCGLHLDRGYRLAFSMQPPLTDEDRPRVVLLYVGKREPGHRASAPPDIWDVLHDLFAVDNPPSGHQKPPCCDDDRPSITHDKLEAFLRALRRVNRGR
jgi:hypothetical protein